jgi:hypothetical protein
MTEPDAELPTVVVELNHEFSDLEPFALQMGLTPIAEGLFMYGNFCEVSFAKTSVIARVLRESHLHYAVEAVAAILRKQRGRIVNMSAAFLPYFDISEAANNDRADVVLHPAAKNSEILIFVHQQCEGFLKGRVDSLSFTELLTNHWKLLVGFQDHLTKVTLNNKHIIREIQYEDTAVKIVRFKDIYTDLLTRVFVIFWLCVIGGRKTVRSNNTWLRFLGFHQTGANEFSVIPEHASITVRMKVKIVRNNDLAVLSMNVTKDIPC